MLSIQEKRKKDESDIAHTSKKQASLWKTKGDQDRM